MIAALFTAIFFALSALCASRSTRLIGPVKANTLRQLCAFSILAACAYTIGQGHHGTGFICFVFSGAVGIGIADMAAYFAIKKIGARLAILLVQCGTAPFGALVEWLWLGTTLTIAQIAVGTVILSGCALALMPDKGGGIPLSRRDLLQGIALGLTGAIGQGVGAVLTRRGYEANALEGLDLSAMTSCFQRMTGSLIVTGIIIICIRLVPVSTPVLYPQHAASYRKATPWIVANALSGLVIGVSLLQWALKYYPTGIVLAIVATTPILLMPLTYLIEGDKPSVRATIGAVIAVGGVIVLNIL